MPGEPILSVRDLVIDFEMPEGTIRVIDGITFDVYPNEVVCIVGESSSGKSVTMLAVIGLLPRAARIVSGEILFNGRDMGTFSEEELRRLRGGELAMIFQDPMTSLNPVIRVGKQIREMIRLHNPKLSRSAARSRVIELLKQVEVPNAEGRYSSYPHEFSGGMRQRAMIAMAMANNPALLIADEPTTALDVTIQAQVLDVLRGIRESRESAMVLITHDLGVVAETADRVVVMYCGRVMETGLVEQIFNDPRHPYTAGLIASLLRIDAATDELHMIKGQPEIASKRPSGCPFHPRCSMARPKCSVDVPEVRSLASEHAAACHFAEETPAWIARELPHISLAPVEVLP
jgi:oligopeptide/dipeptide ABC transporter ATP-binding protein